MFDGDWQTHQIFPCEDFRLRLGPPWLKQTAELFDSLISNSNNCDVSCIQWCWTDNRLSGGYSDIKRPSSCLEDYGYYTQDILRWLFIDISQTKLPRNLVNSASRSELFGLDIYDCDSTVNVSVLFWYECVAVTSEDPGGGGGEVGGPDPPVIPKVRLATIERSIWAHGERAHRNRWIK